MILTTMYLTGAKNTDKYGEERTNPSKNYTCHNKNFSGAHPKKERNVKNRARSGASTIMP
jgi:hypothetical protein